MLSSRRYKGCKVLPSIHPDVAWMSTNTFITWRHGHLFWWPAALMCAWLPTHTFLNDQKKIHHTMGQGICTTTHGYMAGHMMSLKRAARGSLQPDSACGANSGRVQSGRCSIHCSLLPCITAIAEQQAILTVTSATHLTEGWIILPISTLSFRVLNWNLNRTGIHSLCRMWHFKIHCHTNSSEGIKVAVTHQNVHLVCSAHLGNDEMPDNIYLSCLLSDTNDYRELHFKNRQNKNPRIRSKVVKQKKDAKNENKEKSKLHWPLYYFNVNSHFC